MASNTMAKFRPRTKLGKAIRSSPNMSKGIVKSFPKKLFGTTSPYPTVLMVTRENHAVLGMESKAEGSPSESMNAANEGSHVPRSAKYMRVEKSTSTRMMKNVKAQSASLERLTATYMTSIVRSI